MADEANEVEETTEEQSQEGTTEVVEETSSEEAQQTEQAEGTQEEETHEADPNEQFLLKGVVDGKEVVWDIRDQDQRKQAIENAQKGYHYTQRMQSLSEREKASEQWAELGRAVVNDPNFMQSVIAQRMGYDPSILYGTLNPPPEWLRDSDPNAYAQQLTAYYTAQHGREVVKNATEDYKRNTAAQNNAVVFQRARTELNLDDKQAQELQSFVESKFKPNAFGMYEYADVEGAYWARFGRERAASEKVKASEQIRKTIQKAKPNDSRSNRPPKLSKAEREDKGFLEFVQANA